MIKVVQTADAAETIRRLVHAMNFSEVVLPFAAVTEGAVVTAGTPALFGGVVVDRSVFQKLLPDARWVVYAAGFVATSDANLATVSLSYQKDDTTAVLLGSVTHTGGFAKKVLGPFDVFGTAGVPPGEMVPVVRLGASKATAGTASLAAWVVWLSLQPGGA